MVSPNLPICNRLAPKPDMQSFSPQARLGVYFIDEARFGVYVIPQACLGVYVIFLQTCTTGVPAKQTMNNKQ